MLEKFPGEEENREKDFIIARSPLLRMFIDKYSQTDSEMWVKMITKTFLEKRNEIIDLVGTKIVEKDVNVHLKVAKEYNVFTTDDVNTKVALILCFCWMGYEIGEKTKVDLFRDDIIETLYIFDVINETEETEIYVNEVIQTGVTWRAEIENDAPDEFKDFFSKIDF
jgi:hypothetical protein